MKKKISNNTATNKATVHFTENYLINPTNAVTVNVIGAGGTGSRVITALAELHSVLNALEHPGLQVALYDDDIVTEPNLVKQRFAVSELGMYKAVARINNINRWFGTSWKAVTKQYNRINLHRFTNPSANIFITCVDKVQARFDIADIIKELSANNDIYQPYKPFYWLDFGNGKSTGQVILSTATAIPQPKSEKFNTISTLPFVTDEFGELLNQSETNDDTPSCSAQEALEKQELYINASLVPLGCELLYKLFRNAMIEYRGVFHNLENLRTVPIMIAQTA